MNQRRPGKYIAGFLLLVLVFTALFVYGGLIISTDSFLSFKYQPYRTAIGAGLIILGLAVLGLAAWFMVWGMRRMATNLDLLFGHLGLTAGPDRDGRHYFGEINGRRVDIFCRPIRGRRYFGDVKVVRYVGHTLDVYAEAELLTRGSVGLVREGEGFHERVRSEMIKYLSAKALERLGREIATLEDGRFPDWSILALDPDWMRSFLEKREIREPLETLLGDTIKCLRQHLQVLPGAVRFTALTGISYLRPDVTDRIVESVLEIAKAAEGLPRAGVVSEETEAEREARTGSTES